jgi:glycosyltransferase involved in cell wall biosynthesis
MKILQVIPYFVPAWDFGGPLAVCYELSKELVKRGHQVTVFTTDALSRHHRVETPEEIIDGIYVKRFRNIGNILASQHNIFFSPSMKAAMNDLSDYDIVHLHEYTTLQNIIAHKSALSKSLPYVLQAHGSLPLVGGKLLLKRAFNHLFGYRLIRDASALIAVTQTEANQYVSMGGDKRKIIIIPNGIDMNNLHDLSHKGAFRRKYSLPDDTKIVLYLGRIHQIKGLDLLAKAFADLSKEMNGVKLVIVGPDDGYLSELQKLIRELKIEGKVLLTGPLYAKDKLEAYIDADVYVLPSYYETFPISVLEAIACSKPVIITDQCGIADMVKNNNAGIVVPCDADQLASAILQLLNNPENAEYLGKNGKSLVYEYFTWDKIAEQVENLYYDCLASKSYEK